MYRSMTAGCLGLGLMWIAASISPAADPAVPAGYAAARMMARESSPHAEARRSAFMKLDITKGEPAPATAGTAPMTIDDLKTMLDNMGYEVKVDQYKDGSKYLTTNIPHSSWTFIFTFDLSPDKTNWWIGSYLGDVKDPSKVRADRLLKVLELENSAWPGYYAYFSQPQTVYYYRPLTNSNVKPALLRTTLESSMDSMMQTADTWDPANWSTAPATPTPTTTPGATPPAAATSSK
ncbi:MAG TPA: hypothetical protein VG713_01295 [Pirellulales bacterium]|nr:hypothetical protein [Pirellulales bacterium]